MTELARELGVNGRRDPTQDVGYADPQPRKGFFTDTSVCIGCKACEVACKEWNNVPDRLAGGGGEPAGLNLLGMSYDNTGSLGANTWRHVAFIEQNKPLGHQEPGLRGEPAGPPMSEVIGEQVAEAVSRTADHGGQLGTSTGEVTIDVTGTAAAHRGYPVGDGQERTELRWLMSSDVCKHCTHAACLDVCPTGSLFRTEHGTVVVQEEICNGCGYCVPACPYGVIDQRPDDGRVWKCTLCYDRLGDDLEPACAKACPTNSIQYGLLEDLRQRAAERVEQLHAAGVDDARLYGEDPDDGVGGAGAFFLLLDEPEVYGFPPDPVVTTRDLPRMYGHALVAAAGAMAAAVASFALAGRRP